MAGLILLFSILILQLLLMLTIAYFPSILELCHSCVLFMIVIQFSFFISYLPMAELLDALPGKRRREDDGDVSDDSSVDDQYELEVFIVFHC